MEATGESSARNDGGSRAKHIVSAACWLLAVIAVLALAHQLFGLGWTRQFIVGPAGRMHEEDGSYRWALPEAYRGPLMDSRGTLTEDGAEVFNLAAKSSDVKRWGASWWNIHAGALRFVPPDGSDPRSNGRAYVVTLPVQIENRVLWIIAALLVACLMLRARFAAPEGGDSRPPTVAAQCGVVFLLVLALLAARILTHRDYCDPTFVGKDLAESDAGGWHETAAALARGLPLTSSGFSGQRPMHAVMLAPVMAVFGDHTLVARMMNCVLFAIAAAGLWCLGALLRCRWLSLALVAVLVWHQDRLGILHAVLTENSGLTFSIVAFLATWAAVWELSPRWSFLAGATNGLGVLASGVTLFALPFYTLIVLVNPLARRAPWRRTVLMVVMFIAGTSAVLLPWMARQKIVLGQFTLSLNTAEVLAGAASPEGRLSPALLAEVEAPGREFSEPGMRYAYFMGRFKEMVAADPGAFLRHAGRSFLGSFAHVQVEDPVFLLCGALIALLPALAAGLRGSGGWHLLAALVVIAGWTQMRCEQVLPVTAALGFLAWRRARWPEERLTLALAFATILGLALLGGLTGNQVTKRAWTATDWAVCAVIFLGIVRLVEVGGAFLRGAASRAALTRPLAGTPPPSEPRRAKDTPPTLRALALVMTGFSLASVAFVNARIAIGPRDPYPDLLEFDAKTAGAALVARHPDLAGMDAGKLIFKTALFTGMKAAMRQWEDSGNWMPHYRSRPFPRTLALMRWWDAEALHSLRFESAQISSLPDGLPVNEPLLCVMTENPGVNRLNDSVAYVKEILLLAPLRRGADGKWSVAEDAARFVKPTPEAMKTLGGVK